LDCVFNFNAFGTRSRYRQHRFYLDFGGQVAARTTIKSTLCRIRAGPWDARDFAFFFDVGDRFDRAFIYHFRTGNIGTRSGFAHRRSISIG
jgi:hypothetical protein